MTDNLVSGFSCLLVVIIICLGITYIKIGRAHVGQMVSNDYFYQPDENWYKPLEEMGILAVDMEAHISL